MNGAEYLVRALISKGTDTVFGYPGATVLSVYDALYKHRKEIRHIRTSHEQGAAHAADGYARMSGKPGVCIATSGPGATNLVTGIANAFLDSVPTIYITGNVEQSLIGTDSFQEVDITGIVMAVTKHTFRIRSAEELIYAINDAYEICMSGRKGPVLIDIPRDILEGNMMCREIDTVSRKYTCNEMINLDDEYSQASDFEEIVDAINAAQRPLLLVGGGVGIAKAGDKALALARKISAPICSSLMAVGVVDFDEPLNMGLLGIKSPPPARKAFNESDLIIAVGTRLSNRLMKTEHSAKIIHIDADCAEINKVVTPDWHMIADAGKALDAIYNNVHEVEQREWTKELIECRRADVEEKLTADLKDETDYDAVGIFTTIRDVLGEKVCIVTDVGLHQMLAANYYPVTRNTRFLTSGGLGAMGFGMGAAIGAAVASPETPVVLITGDGSFTMNMNEMMTLHREKLEVYIVVLNNRRLGMVHSLQRRRYAKRYSQTSMKGAPSFKRVAKAFHIDGFVIQSKKEFADRLLKARQSCRTTLFDVRI